MTTCELQTTSSNNIDLFPKRLSQVHQDDVCDNNCELIVAVDSPAAKPPTVRRCKHAPKSTHHDADATVLPATSSDAATTPQWGPKCVDPDRKVLVNLLQFGADLEHTLMCSYLYTAYSMKTRPEEFHENGDRAAIEFELARDMRKEMLDVAVEEMFHLHIVQCLLRGLGELPKFLLPEKSALTNWQWSLKEWRPLLPNSSRRDGSAADPTAAAAIKPPVMVPLQRFSQATIANFVSWESPDSLQVIDPVKFEPVWERIRLWELNYRVNVSLHSCTDPVLKDKLFHTAFDMYNGTVNFASRPDDVDARLRFVRGFPDDMNTFSSVHDLYYGTPTAPAYGILPLYKQAWEKGWMSPTHGDGKDLFGEICQNIPQNGFYQYLPVAPVFSHGRDMARLKHFNMQNPDNVPEGNPHKGGPTFNFQTVSDLVEQLVGEGEGFNDFPSQVMAFLDKDEDVQLYSDYYLWHLWYREQLPEPFPGGAPSTNVVPPPAPPAPPLFNDAERIRQSHLYRFGHMHKMVAHESAVLGKEWKLHRDSITSAAPEIHQLRTSLPLFFNGMYLILFTWLARFYASNSTWESDETPVSHRRTALESLATWPLMSMAIRPLLEIAGWFGDEVSNYLFLQDGTYLPTDLPDYQDLLSTYLATVRAGGATQAQNIQMDQHALHIMAHISDWAQRMHDQLTASKNLNPTQRLVITQALSNVIAMREIVKQYPFRVAGGFCDILPNSDYVKEHAATMYAFEENPIFPPTAPIPTSAVKAIRKAARTPTASLEQRQLAEQLPQTPTKAIFQNSLVLRIRYSGWFRLAMPTDPDPNRDTVGCTGTNMLHPADLLTNGPQASLVRYATTRAKDPIGIARGPFDPSVIPACDVSVIDAAILVGGFVHATLTNLHEPGKPHAQPPKGPPNSQWIWPEWTLSNLSDPIAMMDCETMQLAGGMSVNFEKRPGRGEPFHWCGENHVIAQDGEPIDPYIVSFVDKGDPRTAFQRDVFGNTTMEQMDPLQRTESCRMCPLEDAGGNQLYINMVYGPNAYDWMKFRTPENLKRLGWNDSQDAYQFCLTYLSDRADQLIHAAGALDPNDSDFHVEFVSYLDRAKKATDRRDQYQSLLRFGMFWGHTVSGDLRQPAATPRMWQWLETVMETGLKFKTNSDRTQPNSRWMTSQMFGLQDYDALSTFTAGTMYIPIEAVPIAGGGKQELLLLHASWSWDANIYDDLCQFAVRFESPFWATYTILPKPPQGDSEVQRAPQPHPIDDDSKSSSSSRPTDSRRQATLQLQLSPPLNVTLIETRLTADDEEKNGIVAKVVKGWRSDAPASSSSHSPSRLTYYSYAQTGLLVPASQHRSNDSVVTGIVGVRFNAAKEVTTFSWTCAIPATSDEGVVAAAQFFAQCKAQQIDALSRRYGSPIKHAT